MNCEQCKREVKHLEYGLCNLCDHGMMDTSKYLGIELKQLNTCELCNTPTLFRKNRYCETCANNLWVGLELELKCILHLDGLPTTKTKT